MARIGVVIHTELRGRLFSPEDTKRLEALGNVVWTQSPKPISVEDACGLLKDCEIGVGSWGTPWCDPAVVAACPNLKLWEHAAGTVKHMFGPHLKGRDITIASCATAIADYVAEMTLGQMILGARGAVSRALKQRGEWDLYEPKPGSLYYSTVGIIGASLIGRRVIELLKPFGARVLLYDPYVSEAEAKDLGVELVDDVVSLCSMCDVVSLHTPIIPSTEKMLGAREFQAMRDDAVLINTARGRCIDEEALIAELEKGRLFAFIDVTDPEPPAQDSPLRKLPNAFYTPHIAGGPGYKLGAQVVGDIEAFLNGTMPMRVVTPDMLERIA